MRLANKNVSRKAAAITVASALTVFGGAGAALAYWTTTGSGSGNTTVATANGTLVLSSTDDAKLLAPGTAGRAVTVHAANASQTDLQVRQFTVKLSATGKTAAELDTLGVVLSGTGVSMDAGHAGEYTIDQADVTVGHGSLDTVVGGFQLSINDDPANSQDALKGLQINLALASS
jgi:hypothetical protein